MKECCAGPDNNEYCRGFRCCDQCTDFRASLEPRMEGFTIMKVPYDHDDSSYRSKPMKKARIKGTEFELENWSLQDVHGSDIVVANQRVSLPIDWVEFYDPPREEPPMYSVELDDTATAWQRLEGGWYMVGRHSGGITWELLQNTWGPTKPMKVDDEQA